MTFQDLKKASEVLDDEDFSLFLLINLHPELSLKKIVEWSGEIKNKRNFQNTISLEGMRLRILSCQYRVNKDKLNYESLEEFKNSIKEYKKRKKEDKEKILDRVSKLMNEGLEENSAIWQAVNEFNFVFSVSEIKSELERICKVF